MQDQEANGQPTPFQKIIIQQIARHFDDDGYCRMTNAALAKICSGVKKQRLHKEITLLVRSGYLRRELEQHDAEDYTERRLWLVREAIAKGQEVNGGLR